MPNTEHRPSGNDRRDRPPVPAPLGRALEPLYRVVVTRRNRRFDAGIGVHSVRTPVISVGNLSVGGTGKTPTVMLIATMLLDTGCKPGIAMRGYKAKAGAPSDEQMEYALRLPDVPVEADPDRIDAARRLEQRRCDAIILDDGFQHRRLARDLDIVLIDASRPAHERRCLPAGWLREPVESLARASAVILTRSDLAHPDALAELERLIAQHAPNAVIAQAAHAWTALDGGSQPMPLDELRGARVVAACGIGHPGAFLQQLGRHGATIVDAAVKPDHHHWTAADAASIAHSLPPEGLLVTTSKDWVKLRDVLPGTVAARTRWPRLGIELTTNAQAVRELVLAVVRAPAGTRER